MMPSKRGRSKLRKRGTLASCMARMSEIDSVRCGLARFWLPDMTSTLFTWEGMGFG